MENLLASRLVKDEEQSHLVNLSPEKYGKAAYANLTYTPSRLADNLLFREAITLKKTEETTNKFRECDALNNLLHDRLDQLKEERDGIEQSLTQQIFMYKKMVVEMEVKHESRIKEIQKGFKEEMMVLVRDKEEEAKYAQSEKELLENRIFELEALVAELKAELKDGGSNMDNLTKEHEKLEIHYQNIQEKLKETEAKAKDDADKAKAQYEELSRKSYNAEVEARSRVEKLIMDKEKEIENIERIHRNELEKSETRRQQESTQKSQELKCLNKTFESEAHRLNNILNQKDDTITTLSNQLSEEKQKLLDLTREYTNQMNNLIHEKNRLEEDLTNSLTNERNITEELKIVKNNCVEDIGSMEAYNNKLKDDLQLCQVNLQREIERGGYMANDLEKEVLRLRYDNERIGVLVAENDVLVGEIRNLKELLLESSLEMENCKEEFLRMGREKDHLIARLREMGIENESLNRIRLEREEEARGWRDSYYLSRH